METSNSSTFDELPIQSKCSVFFEDDSLFISGEFLRIESKSCHDLQTTMSLYCSLNDALVAYEKWLQSLKNVKMITIETGALILEYEKFPNCMWFVTEYQIEKHLSSMCNVQLTFQSTPILRT